MSKNILIVDDSPSIRQMVEVTLKSASYPVTTAVDGQDALDQCKVKRFDFVLTDQNMPRMDGREVLSALRESTDLKHIPVIMFSTSDTDVDVKDCYDLGCNTYMTKPCDYLSLTDAMQLILLYWTGNSTLLTVQ